MTIDESIEFAFGDFLKIFSGSHPYTQTCMHNMFLMGMADSDINQEVLLSDDTRITMRGIIELIIKKYAELKNCINSFNFSSEEVYGRLSVDWKDGKTLVTWESIAEF